MRRRASAAAAGRRRRRRFRSCRRRPAPAARIRRWTTSRRRNEGTPRRRPPAMSETARAPLVSRTPAAPAAAPPVPAEASSVRSVRDALGNRGFACFLQAKLTVGHPDDPLEREADDVAEQVMRMPDESVSTQGMSPPAVQRKCAECEQADEDEQSMRVQTKRDGPAAMTSASSDIASRVAALGGRGDPLAPGIRSYFEPRFGRDLGAVPGGTPQFFFRYKVAPGQVNPATLFRNQPRVQVVATTRSLGYQRPSIDAEPTTDRSLTARFDAFKKLVRDAGRVRLLGNRRALDMWRAYLATRLTPGQIQAQVHVSEVDAILNRA